MTEKDMEAAADAAAMAAEQRESASTVCSVEEAHAQIDTTAEALRSIEPASIPADISRALQSLEAVRHWLDEFERSRPNVA